jgi:hypothetical protein
MVSFPRREDIDPLRVSIWVAVGLVVAYVIVLPGIFEGPVTHVGDSLTLHWIPLALLAWVVVARNLRRRTRVRGVRLSKPYPRSTRDLG